MSLLQNGAANAAREGFLLLSLMGWTAVLDWLVPTDKCATTLIRAAVLDGLVLTDKP